MELRIIRLLQYHTHQLVSQWAPNWPHKRHNRRHINITLVRKIVNQLESEGTLSPQDMIGLCTLFLLGLRSTTRGEETKSHLVDIENVFYWRCPDLSGRQHWRGATLEEGCHRCTSSPRRLWLLVLLSSCKSYNNVSNTRVGDPVRACILQVHLHSCQRMGCQVVR